MLTTSLEQPPPPVMGSPSPRCVWLAASSGTWRTEMDPRRLAPSPLDTCLTELEVLGASLQWINTGGEWKLVISKFINQFCKFYQSQKQLFNPKCLLVHSSVSPKAKPHYISHPSFLTYCLLRDFLAFQLVYEGLNMKSILVEYSKILDTVQNSALKECHGLQ